MIRVRFGDTETGEKGAGESGQQEKPGLQGMANAAEEGIAAVVILRVTGAVGHSDGHGKMV